MAKFLEDLDLSGCAIENVKSGTSPQSAVSKQQLEDAIAGATIDLSQHSLSELAPPTAALAVGGFPVTGVGSPIGPDSAINYDLLTQVMTATDDSLKPLEWAKLLREPVQAATYEPVTLHSGIPTIDGVSAPRMLLLGQTPADDNGYWIASDIENDIGGGVGKWVRHLETYRDIQPGALIYVKSGGATLGNTYWYYGGTFGGNAAQPGPWTRVATLEDVDAAIVDAAVDPRLIPLNEFAQPTDTIDLGGQKILGVQFDADPTAAVPYAVAGQLAGLINVEKGRVDDLQTAKLFHFPAQLATDEPIALTGLPVIDGIQVSSRTDVPVLLMGQADPAENGIWYPTREDLDLGAGVGVWRRYVGTENKEIIGSGLLIHVSEGTKFGGTTFIFNNGAWLYGTGGFDAEGTWSRIATAEDVDTAIAGATIDLALHSLSELGVPTADLDVGGFKLINVADGVDPTDGVNKAQVDAAIAGVAAAGTLEVDWASSDPHYPAAVPGPVPATAEIQISVTKYDDQSVPGLNLVGSKIDIYDQNDPATTLRFSFTELMGYEEGLPAPSPIMVGVGINPQLAPDPTPITARYKIVQDVPTGPNPILDLMWGLGGTLVDGSPAGTHDEVFFSGLHGVGVLGGFKFEGAVSFDFASGTAQPGDTALLAGDGADSGLWQVSGDGTSWERLTTLDGVEVQVGTEAHVTNPISGSGGEHWHCREITGPTQFWYAVVDSSFSINRLAEPTSPVSFGNQSLSNVAGGQLPNDAVNFDQLNGLSTTVNGRIDYIENRKLNEIPGPDNAVWFNDQQLKSLADGTDPQDAVTKRQLDGAQMGIDWKNSVFVVATSNVALTGLQTIAGETLEEDDLVLCVGQDDGTENLAYHVHAGPWEIAEQFADGNLSSGAYVPVETAGVKYRLATANPIQVGTTELDWQVADVATTYVGDGQTIDVTGGVISAITTKLARKMEGTLGDGALTLIPIAHNFGTKAVVSQVWDVATGETVNCGMLRTDNNTMTYRFANAPAAGAYGFAIQG